MSAIVLCPKCGGQKHVIKPPWVPGDQHEWSSTGTQTYPCPTCDGKGYLAIDPVPLPADNAAPESPSTGGKAAVE